MRLGLTSVLLGMGLAAAVSSAQAGEALPPDVAQRLDGAPAEFSMSAAKRERLMIIQENMARQRHYGRGGYGYDRGGYGRGYRGGPGYGGGYRGGPRYQPPPSYFGCGGVPCQRW